ncbi:unnamed protein product [Phytomonas sp. Hart1]|nr:unnamed protein product [Phytomonas sp. Hart1]|eukprot:CCW66853.1 unnamed protein product [Phytomonas sp. isolate Hart1]
MEGALSSCNHFFCFRCVQKIKSAPAFGSSCPICKKCYNLFSLKSSNINPLLLDADITLQNNTKLVSNQIFYYQQTIARMRSVLMNMRDKFKVLESQMQEKDNALTRALEERQRQQEYFSMYQTRPSYFTNNNNQLMMPGQYASLDSIPSGHSVATVSHTLNNNNFQVRKNSGENSLNEFEPYCNIHTNTPPASKTQLSGGKLQPSGEHQPLGWAESSHGLKRHRENLPSTHSTLAVIPSCPNPPPSEHYSASSSHAYLTPNSCSNANNRQKTPSFHFSTSFSNPKAPGNSRGQHSIPPYGSIGSRTPKLLQGLLSHAS